MGVGSVGIGVAWGGCRCSVGIGVAWGRCSMGVGVAWEQV